MCVPPKPGVGQGPGLGPGPGWKFVLRSELRNVRQLSKQKCLRQIPYNINQSINKLGENLFAKVSVATHGAARLWITFEFCNNPKDWDRSRLRNKRLVRRPPCWSAESLTPTTSGQRCHWHRLPADSSVIDTDYQRTAVSLTPPTFSKIHYRGRKIENIFLHFHFTNIRSKSSLRTSA
jgi:hypothetical protein